jgi:hypothetical protein
MPSVRFRSEPIGSGRCDRGFIGHGRDSLVGAAVGRSLGERLDGENWNAKALALEANNNFVAEAPL